MRKFIVPDFIDSRFKDRGKALYNKQNLYRIKILWTLIKRGFPRKDAALVYRQIENYSVWDLSEDIYFDRHDGFGHWKVRMETKLIVLKVDELLSSYLIS